MQRGWGFFRAERNEYLDILPASQRVDETKWYLGTADAVAQNIDIVDSYNVKYVIILAGDHVYKMDYEIMLAQHVETGADVTIGCLTVPRAEASAFGVMAVTSPCASPRFWKSRKIRRRSPAIRTMRWPRWGFMSLTGPSCAICCCAIWRMTIPAMISAMT
jgi:ADP-glucose pyrophosphorylase